MTDPTLEAGVAAHDQALADLGLDIWVGTEPTFTDRFSTTTQWLTAALGDDKFARAETLLRALHARLGGAVVRTSGRQYPGEDLPRWSLGLYGRRDGAVVWNGPPDPAIADALDEDSLGDEPQLQDLQAALGRQLDLAGYVVRAFAGEDGSLRVLASLAQAPSDIADDDPRLQRTCLHGSPIPAQGIEDTLAAAGHWLFVLDTAVWRGTAVARIELPCSDTPARYAEWLDALAAAGLAAELGALMLTGYPPPVNADVWLTTITPDPAVIEVNMAPYSNVAGLLATLRELYAAASELGLAPYRLHYNGAVADSGGGGQITLGGRTPESSPFLRVPELLPRLLRYTNHHPALSYLFAHDFVGGSGQAVRSDELGRDALRELALALDALERRPAPDPKALWEALSEHLTDSCGNTHRAELNIEKLWNRHLPNRGMQGLVEFRALRMQHTPERTAALAALLRATVAMLATRGFNAPLRDWGDELHERFALPYYLERDLQAVLADLAGAGLGLADTLVAVLEHDDYRDWARVRLSECELTIRRALEFWPLVGDASQQDGGTSRLIDASTTRLELCLRPIAGETADFAEWQLATENLRLPLRIERDRRGDAKVFALRLRSFVPWRGLHPALPAHGPVRLRLYHLNRGEALNITLHEWRPDNEAYPGPPIDLADARERRLARCVVESVPTAKMDLPGEPPQQALTPYTLDLRWLAGR